MQIMQFLKIEKVVIVATSVKKFKACGDSPLPVQYQKIGIPSARVIRRPTKFTGGKVNVSVLLYMKEPADRITETEYVEQ